MLAATFPISLPAAALGLACVGALYALHHLRIQPQRKPTATLLFWRQAIRPQQTRVPWSKRFTHRKTFTLLATILILLAAALTADRWGTLGGDGRQDVIVIDAGAATATDDGSGSTLLQALKAAAESDLRKLSAGAAVICAGPQPLLISNTGEPSAIAERALKALSPQAGASASSLALLMAGGIGGAPGDQIHWYTANAEMPADLPDAIAKRVVLHRVKAADAVSIVGVTFEPPVDDVTRGTLRVRVAGSAAKGPMTVNAEQAGRPPVASSIAMNGDVGEAGFNLAADGSIVTLNLADAPGAAAMHTAEFRLPDRQPITFRFAGDVPAALKLALLTAGTESPTGTVFVAPQGTPVPPDAKAAVLIVRDGNAVKAGERLAMPADVSLASGLDLEGAVSTDGPALPAAGTSLMTAGDSTVLSLDVTADRPTLRLSASVVSAKANLPRHAAFPVLLGRACDALLHRAAAPATVAMLRSAQDPLWTGPADAPLMAATPVADRPIAASLAANQIDVERGGWTPRWTDVVLAAALALVVIESLLRVARKIV